MMLNRPIFFALLLLISLSLSACVPGCSDLSSHSPKESSTDNRINLFIWGDYTSEKIFEEFERQTRIKVIESNFSSNEELLAKLQAGADGYDLIIPSDYMVTVMRQLDLLEPIDLAEIPNAGNLDPSLMGRDFDPSNSVSLPYSWAVSGLMYNRDKVTPPIKGYRDLFYRDDIKHRIGILDDSREVIGSVLKSMGQSVNTTDDTRLEQAKSILISLKRRAREFTSSPSTMLRQGDLLAAQMYSNEALRLIQTNPEFEFVLPDEGFTIAIDNMAIPRNSRRKANALKLINFLLQEDINIQFSEELLAAPVIKNGQEKLPSFMRSQPSIARFDLIQQRGEMLRDVGKEIRKYDRIWTEVKASAI